MTHQLNKLIEKDLKRLNEKINNITLWDCSDKGRLEVLVLQRDLLLIAKPMSLIYNWMRFEYYPSMTPDEFILSNIDTIKKISRLDVQETMYNLYKTHFINNYLTKWKQKNRYRS